jgi:hypothetical protein
MAWVWAAVAATAPVLAVMCFVHLAAIMERLAALSRRLRGRASSASHPPVEQIAADLHRLSAHLEAVERSRELHRIDRLKAAALAYDALLLQACETLEVEIYASTPLRPLERLETEAALAQQGLVW